MTRHELDDSPGGSGGSSETRATSPKNLLFLAYHFPPIGGAGVQRTVGFTRDLPSFGYRPLVVTGPESADDWPPRDLSLFSQVRGVEVFRLRDRVRKGPSRRRLASAWDRLLRRPSEVAERWIEGVVETAREVARREPIHLIFATMSPFESARAASCLSRELAVPWVADLRDPWALDEMMVYPTFFHRRAAEERMRRGLASAALVVMNTREAGRSLAARFPELGAPGRSVVIPNGFDPADFAGPEPPADPEVFRIVHTGHLHVGLARRHRETRWIRRALGGERVPLNLMTRSHVYLLRALEAWNAVRPLRGRAELALAGPITDADEQVIRESPVAHLVRVHGYLDHTRSIELMRSADLLFLPMHGLPHGTRSRIVPGKTYEYLAAGRPILAALPDGDARDLVSEAGTARICRPDDVPGMAEILSSEFELRRERRLRPAPAGLLRSFERPRLCARLAQALDGLLDATGSGLRSGS